MTTAQEILARGPMYWTANFASTGLHWRKREQDELRVLAEAGTPIDKCAEVMGRSATSLAHRARDFGMSMPAAWGTLIAPKRMRILTEPKVLLSYPYIVKHRSDDARLLLLVNAAVPRALPEELRADVCQDMLLALLTGALSEEAIARSVGQFVAAARKGYASKWDTVSINAPIPYLDDETYADRIEAPDWQASFDEADERLDRDFELRRQS